MCYIKSSLRKLLQIRPNTGPLPLGSWKKITTSNRVIFVDLEASVKRKKKTNKQCRSKLYEWFNGTNKNPHNLAIKYQ